MKTSKKNMSMKTMEIIATILRVLLAIVLVTFSIFPVLWIVSAAINPVNDLANQKLIPDNANFNNFTKLVDNPIFPFFTWMKNSLFVSVISTVLTVSLTTLAAYAFSRFRFKGRQGLLKAILLVQSFPNLLALVALYSIINQMGDLPVIGKHIGLNTHWGLILVYMGGAMGMNIWLMKGYMDTIPRDIDESAKVDGATDWQIFSQLLLPLLRPILVVIAILSFIGTYGEFMLARTFLTTTEKQTVMVGLQIFTAGQYTKNWGVFAAGALIAALPIMIIYLVLQDQIVGGLTAGSVKG